MTTHSGAPVVVGIDGSARALEATRLAAAEAALHHRPLRIVHVMQWPRLFGDGRSDPPDSLKSQAHVWLHDAALHAAEEAPGIPLVKETLVGPPAAKLIGATASAFLLVIGDRGMGGFTGLSTGSMAVQVAMHGAAPVLVVRGTPAVDGPVVVGVDGSASAARALTFAAQEASLRGTELVALHAWTMPALVGPPAMMPLAYDPPAIALEEQRVLAEALAGIGEKHPDLTVRRELPPGPPARALIDAARHAQLVVVGSRGRGGFAGMLLGSVSQHLLHHATCPVVVVESGRS
ncbi:universal stress protein [Actinoplanes sp. NPDC049265]|uniref:universal stress protein n=1 Tax=Actinoplanes sp. NPDC049265 TaxID=3363902 RepID=UPI0037148DE6